VVKAGLGCRTLATEPTSRTEGPTRFIPACNSVSHWSDSLPSCSGRVPSPPPSALPLNGHLKPMKSEASHKLFDGLRPVHEGPPSVLPTYRDVVSIAARKLCCGVAKVARTKFQGEPVSQRPPKGGPEIKRFWRYPFRGGRRALCSPYVRPKCGPVKALGGLAFVQAPLPLQPSSVSACGPSVADKSSSQQPMQDRTDCPPPILQCTSTPTG